MKTTRIIAAVLLFTGALAPHLALAQELVYGEVLFIPAGTPHAVKNVGSGNAAELATYIVERGRPLLVLGK
jgi:mannose-6-phosphate isomerase class I